MIGGHRRSGGRQAGIPAGCGGRGGPCQLAAAAGDGGAPAVHTVRAPVPVADVVASRGGDDETVGSCWGGEDGRRQGQEQQRHGPVAARSARCSITSCPSSPHASQFWTTCEGVLPAAGRRVHLLCRAGGGSGGRRGSSWPRTSARGAMNRHARSAMVGSSQAVARSLRRLVVRVGVGGSGPSPLLPCRRTAHLQSLVDLFDRRRLRSKRPCAAYRRYQSWLQA